jgi:hypothetical protein
MTKMVVSALSTFRVSATCVPTRTCKHIDTCTCAHIYAETHEHTYNTHTHAHTVCIADKVHPRPPLGIPVVCSEISMGVLAARNLIITIVVLEPTRKNVRWWCYYFNASHAI